MLYIRPTDNGYEAYDIYHHLVFVEKDCDLLFSFLESSSEKITDLLKTYFDKRIDLKTLSKKDGKVSIHILIGLHRDRVGGSIERGCYDPPVNGRSGLKPVKTVFLSFGCPG